ncbi:MAG: acyltransferase [Clostridiales bacterium]|nr:acyltransferase [Clostridiales bacterium]
MDQEMTPLNDRNAEQVVSSLSNTFYAYKAMAILFVVMMHCIYSTRPVSRVAGAFGILGVPIFFFTSGFFFDRREATKVFWKKKMRSIVIPWLLYGTLLYLFACALNNFSKVEIPFLKWIIGNGSWLYYVPVLIQCFILFRICDNKWFDMVVFLLFILSNVLCVLDIIDHLPWYTKYQMVFNWCGFFQLGMIARKNILAVMTLLNRKPVKAAIVGLWILSAIYYFTTDFVGYWSPVALVHELLGIVAFFVIADTCLKKANLLVDIGKNTYVIFFLHMQFGIPTVRRIFTPLGLMENEWVRLLLQPASIVLSVYAGIKAVQWISKKFGLEKITRIFRI